MRSPLREYHQERATKSKRASESRQSGVNPHPLQSRILQLQKTAGNRTVRGMLQAKLAISQPGDKWEREADRVAEAVMRMPERPAIEGRCGGEPGSTGEYDHCARKRLSFQQHPPIAASLRAQNRSAVEQEKSHTNPAKKENPLVQERKERQEILRAKQVNDDSSKLDSDLAARINKNRAGGQILPTTLRTFFEKRFGAAFNEVRVHTDNNASEMASMLNARAFTIGRDIFFRHAQYSPETLNGRRLLAHELVHTLQKNTPIKRAMSCASSAHADKFFETTGDIIEAVTLYDHEGNIIAKEQNVNSPFFDFAAILNQGKRYSILILYAENPPVSHFFLWSKPNDVIRLAVCPREVIRRIHEIGKIPNPLRHIIDRYGLIGDEFRSRILVRLIRRYLERERASARINSGLDGAIKEYRFIEKKIIKAEELNNQIISSIIGVLAVGTLGALSNILSEGSKHQMMINVTEDFAQAGADKLSGFVKLSRRPPSFLAMSSVVDMNNRKIDLNSLLLAHIDQMEYVLDLITRAKRQAVEYNTKKGNNESLQKIINVYTRIEFNTNKIAKDIKNSEFYKVAPKQIDESVWQEGFEKAFWAHCGRDWRRGSSVIIRKHTRIRVYEWKGDILYGIGDPMAVRLNKLLKKDGIKFDTRIGASMVRENTKFYDWAKSYRPKRID